MVNSNQKFTKKAKIDNLIDVGHARHSLGIQLPIAAFILSITIVILVGMFFYKESEQLLLKQEVERISIESSLVEPIIKQFYQQANSDVLFLSNTPPISGLINAQINEDPIEYSLWEDRLDKIFVEFINVKSYYTKLRFIGVANDGLELLNVHRIDNQIISVPQTQLQTKKDRSYFSKAIEKGLGQVYFSEITLNKEHGENLKPYKPVIRVATPVFVPDTGEIFGFVIISIDFKIFSQALSASNISNNYIYLANEEGDYLYHPNNDKTFGFEFGNRFVMQDDFSTLKEAIQSNIEAVDLPSINRLGQNYIGHYSRLLLEEFGDNQSLRLLILRDTSTSLLSLDQLQRRSFFYWYGFSLYRYVISDFCRKAYR